VASDVQQNVLVLRCRNPGHRPDLGIRHLAVAEGLVDPRQRADRMSDSKLLPGRARADPAMEIQPLGAARHAVTGPLPRIVELRDQLEKPVGRCGDFAPKLEDFLFDRKYDLSSKTSGLISSIYGR
jgi:hypothetical protein